MTTEGTSKKTSRAQLVKLDRGFKLAEQWVNNMGKSLDDDKSNAAILEARPPRLGIGATVPRGPTYVRSNDPIERKLRGTLNAKEKKVDRKAPADQKVEEKGDTDDEESESKTQAFAKKRLSLPTFGDRKKKQK